jgi:signal transduction histidine kinase
VCALSEPQESLTFGLTTIAVVFTAATIRDTRTAIGAVALMSATTLIRDLDDSQLGGWFDVLLDQIFNAMAIGAALVVRRRQHQVDHVAGTVAELADDAARDERTRIARELHDVIAHGMSVMVVQADAARHGTTDPEAAAALRAIEDTGRESLREMRRLVGLLRDGDGESDDLCPQPGLADLPSLVQSVHRAGLSVDLCTEGEAPALAPGVDLAAYRIVQEALTNTMRHAGPARATVRLTYERHGVELEITDSGRGNGRAPSTGGRGLVGMRERAQLYGGRVDAGPGERGYVVRAWLPIDAPTR